MIKKRRFIALFAVAAVILLVSLACLSSGNDSDQNGDSPDLEATAAALEATQNALNNQVQDSQDQTEPEEQDMSEPAAEDEMSEPAAEDDTSDSASTGEIDWGSLSSGDMVYVTQFDHGLDGWYWDQIIGGNNWEVEGGSDYLRFAIDDTRTQIGAMYENVYVPRGQGIIVEAAFDNVGNVRNNNIILMCQINENGWYEFIMTSSGLWFIARYDNDSGNWTNLAQGGLPNYDKNVTDHVLTALCDSNGDLGFAYDYKELKNGFINDKTHKEGYTGLSVYDANIPGVEVEFDWFQLEVP